MRKEKEIRHTSNPFLENMIVPVKSKQVKLSKIGKDDNVLINNGTGEHHGTHVTTYKKVDNDKFVKVFAKNIALTFDLNAAGIKAFNLLIWSVQHKCIDKDLVPLDKFTLDEFLTYHSTDQKVLKLSIATLNRGLRELEGAQIIAKAMRAGFFYINPNFVFNGDRIAFTTLIERNSTE